MIKKVTRVKMQELYQIQIPSGEHRFLLQVESNDDHPVVDFLEEFCPKEWDILYRGHRYTIIGRKKGPAIGGRKPKTADDKAIF